MGIMEYQSRHGGKTSGSCEVSDRRGGKYRPDPESGEAGRNDPKPRNIGMSGITGKVAAESDL